MWWVCQPYTLVSNPFKIFKQVFLSLSNSNATLQMFGEAM